MTKVASLANSANMQFETTAAFLAQIIETTRESAETAGTALKTVVARFSEVKDLYSKGELLGTDEEGEEIDVNKVSKALRTAGINLNEFLTGQRGLDEIFIELASKWDSLDIVQQRYIATMAAGSRQQSRFIALMSDYKRTQELTSAAENAAGASMEQYNKTLESVQTKLNRLKNAWNEFLMGIANDKAIRFALDTVIDFLKGINKLTDGISGGNGLIKSIASLGITIGGLKVGGSIIKKILGDPSAGIKGWIHEAVTGIKPTEVQHTLSNAGQSWGNSLIGGLQNSFKNVKNVFAKTFKKTVTAGQLGVDVIDLSDINLKFNPNIDFSENSVLRNSLSQQLNELAKSGKIGQETFTSLNNSLQESSTTFEQFQDKVKETGVNMQLTGEQADQLGLKFQNQQQALNTTRMACIGLGAAFMGIGAILEKTQGKSSKTVIAFKTIGTTLMGVGAILPVLSGAFQVFGISVTKTIMGIPIIGWIAAAITAIISLIAIINQFNVTAEKQAETAKNAFESASTAANEAKTAYDNLNSSLDKLGEQETNIENLSKGTKEWTEAVKEHNKDVMELIGTYKELDIVSKGGVLTVTNAEEVERLYEQKQYEASFIAAGAQLTAQAAVTRATGHRQTQNDESYNEQITLLRAVREGTTSLNIGAIKKYIEDEGLTSTWAGNFLSGDVEAQQRQVELLNELNGDYKEFIQLERNYMTTIANAAIRMADLDLNQSKYIDTLEGATDVVNDRYQTFSEFINASGLESALNNLSDDLNKDRIEAQYKQYVSSQTGVNVNQINNDGSFEDANGNTRYFSEFSSGFIGSLLRTDLAKSYQQLATTLTKFENSVDTTENIIAQTFASGGSSLTVASLRQLSSNIFSMNSDQVKELAEKIYNDLGGENALGDREVFKEGFVENILNATGNFNRAGTGFSNLTSGVIKSFNESFEKYIQNTSIFDNIINSKLKGMGITEAGDITKILNILAGTDLSSRRDIESVTGILETMGLDVASEEWDNFIDFIIERTGAVDEIDLTHFKENLDSIKKTISDLRSGEHNNIFTDEEYAAIRPYVNEEDFQETAYGMLYVGDDFESLGDKIQQAIRDGFDETSRILENKINLVDVYEQASSKAVKYANGKAAYDRASARNEYEQLGLSSRGVSFDQFYTSRENEYTARETLKNVLQDYDDNIGDLQIPGLADLVKNGGVENLKLEEVKKYLSLIEAEVAKQDENKSQQANLEITKRIEGGLQKLVENWEEGNEADSTAFKYLISDSNLPDFLKQQFLSGFEAAAEESKQDIAWQAVNLSEVYGNAESWEVDLELLSSMAQNYQEIFAAQGEAYETSTAQATRLALANINLNTGLKEIVDSYKSWNEILKQGVEDESIKQTAEYQETIKQLKQSIQQMFGIQGELSNKFIDSAETIALLGQAATGTEEEIQDAINKLRMLAAKDIVASFTLKVDDNDYTELWNTTEQQVQDLLDSIDPSIDIQTQLNPEAQQAVIDSFNELLKAGAITSQQMNDYFSTIGFVPEVEYITSSHWVQHFGKMPTIKYFTNGEPYVDMLDYAWTEKETISVPQIKDLDYSGRAPVINPSTITQAGENAKSSTPKQSSSSKPKQWKNPYDELYNLQEKINSALRERERLEHRYQDMLKDHTKVAQDLTKNSYEEIASLKKQLALQNQMLSGRQKQMKKVLSETYEDSEGNRRTYSSMGVQKYGWYEAATQTVHIEWDKINQVTDENLGGAIEAYISRLEEIRDKIQDTEDAIEDAKDQLLEIAERGKEEYIDFEQQIYDALINQQQKNIETLENINSSIKEAADKTINAIQDEIEKERQARENEKAQEDIYDKEMRLAYLQRDTSGANALEIQKLQEEIQNDQLSYQDKIIDQTIQEMQDEAARAEEQRQAEIDLLNAQLEWDQEHGFYWSQVEALIQSGMNSDGSLKLDSELDQLLKDTEGPLSKFGDIKWKQDLARQIASAMQGRANWEMSVAKEAGEMTLANGTKLSYDAKNDKWYDSKGKEYTNFNWNSEADAFTASKVKTSSTSSTTSTSSSKSASSSDSSVKAYTVRDGDSLWTIAAREYGNGNKAYDIARYNNIGNADMIYTGQVLKLPKKFAKGGLADFTGPAWLDGSKSHPEMVLNAADTQNLITLKNVLAAILQNDTNAAKNSSGNNYFDINIQADIDSDYDVDRLADRIKKQIYDDASYRNVNAINYIR